MVSAPSTGGKKGAALLDPALVPVPCPANSLSWGNPGRGATPGSALLLSRVWSWGKLEEWFHPALVRRFLLPVEAGCCRGLAVHVFPS